MQCLGRQPPAEAALLPVVSCTVARLQPPAPPASDGPSTLTPPWFGVAGRSLDSATRVGPGGGVAGLRLGLIPVDRGSTDP